MDISVVIPTLNEESNIGNILHDLNKQTFKPSEIIVVDGGSNDKTCKIVKEFNAKLIKTAIPVGNQRTVGGQRATGELLIFLDADTRISNNFISDILNAISEKSFGIACPSYIPETRNFIIRITYSFLNELFFLTQRFSANGGGMCIIVLKELFTKVNGFDRKLVFDDIEFIRKCAKKARFLILPKVQVSVSPRRFYEDGILYTAFKYLLLGILFSLNKFTLANKIKYKFAHYKNSSNERDIK